MGLAAGVAGVGLDEGGLDGAELSELAASVLGFASVFFSAGAESVAEELLFGA